VRRGLRPEAVPQRSRVLCLNVRPPVGANEPTLDRIRTSLTANSTDETMDPLTILDVLSRWVHVGTAVVLVGGSVFMRYVLMPAAGTSLGDAEHEALRAQLITRWKKYVMVGIALLLISGFYNYVKVAIPQHKGDGLYHGLMGTKILIALAVFFLASVLTG